jgi:hypothetical protein
MANTLDITDILSKMLAAAEASFKGSWPKIKDLATSSTKTLAQNIVDIEDLKIRGAITNEQAKLKLEVQKNAFKILLLSEEGLGLLAVEAALNAVLGVIKDVVNTAVGFALIV